MLKRSFITIVTLLLASLLKAQPVSRTGLSANVLQNRKIVLDINSPFFKQEFNEIAKKKFIYKLRIINSGSEKNLDSLLPFSVSAIRELEFVNLSGKEFYYLINKLSGCNRISSFSLKNVKLPDLPISFINEKNVSILLIDDCKSINPQSFHILLTGCIKAEKLRIRNCALYSLPDSICLPNVRVIDFRDNKLANAGKQLYKLYSLDSVYLSGNFIPDPVNDFGFFEKSNVMFIETDSITPAVNRKIKEKTVNKTILFHKVEEPAQTESNTFYGQFKTGNSSFVIYSDAYLQYEKLFSNPLSGIYIDTLSLEELFWDTTGNSAPHYLIAFRIFKEKNVIKKHINFGFNKHYGFFKNIKRKGKYRKSNFYRQHPEMNIYKKYTWVIKNEITPADFRSFSKTDFVDLRLKYNDTGKYFTLFLKKSDGKIVQTDVYPVNNGNKRKNINIRKKYPSEYARYLSALAGIARRFDNDLYKNKQKIYSALIRNKTNAWNTLRTYMSLQERVMTETEWLKYYTNVLRYEDEALKSSYPGDMLLKRQLQKLGFKDIYDKEVDSADINIVNVFFTDYKGVNIPVNKIVLINKTNFTYKYISLKPSINPVNLNIPVNDDIAVLVFLPDNSVGIINRESVIDFISNDSDNGMRASVINHGLITIGQILNELQLF